MSSDELPIVDRIAEEFLERCRSGEHPTVDEYVLRYPALGERLRELLPTLEFLEKFKPSSLDDRSECDENVGFESGSPDQIGDYRILREIGRGGMGVVYEAEQLSLGRRVALKVLPKRLSGDEIANERFQREARAAAKLHHRGIVSVFDVGSDGDVSYYAMQLIPGRSLADVQDEVRKLRAHRGPRLETTNLSVAGIETVNGSSMGGRHYWRSIAMLGVQLTRALGYAHAQGVIHRDIKPSNLLLDKDGQVWIADFGLAKTVDDGLTHSGDVVGTLRFMSPERFRGECDESADVYGVGATLYELLVLQPAFHSPDRLRLIEQISKEEPRALRELDPAIPVDLETIISKMLEKDPRRRYRSAEQVAEELERFLAHQPIRARRVSMVERGFRWVRRNRALSMSLGSLLALSVSVAIAATIVAVRMGDLARRNEQSLVLAERELYRSQIQSAADALAGGRIAFARQLLDESPPLLRGFEWGVLHSRLDQSLHSPLSGAGPLFKAQFNQDATRALACSGISGNDLSYSVLDADGEVVLDLTDGEPVREAVLLRDRDTVLAFGRDLRRFSLSRGELLDRQPFDGRFAIWLGDDDYLSITHSGLHRLGSDPADPSARIEGVVRDALLDVNGQRLIVVFDRRVALFDPRTLRELPGAYELPDSGYLLTGRLSPVGSVLAVTSGSGRVYLFRVRDAGLERIHDLSGYSGSPSAQTFSMDGRLFLLGTNLGRIHVFDVESGDLLSRVVGPQSTVSDLAQHPVSERILACHIDGEHHAWSLEAEAFHQLRGHTSFVYPIGFSRDGSMIVSGGWDGFRDEPGALRVWDARSRSQIVALGEPGQTVTAAAFTGDGQRIVAAMQTRSESIGLATYDLSRGGSPRVLRHHGRDLVRRISVHPDGRRVVSVGAYEYAVLWDSETGVLLGQWPISANGITGTGCAFSPDGRWLALVKNMDSIARVDLETNEVVETFKAHGRPITNLAFSQDGRRILSASEDDTVAVFSLDGSEVGRLVGHGADVLCVMESPDGRRIASGGRDDHVLLWDSETLDLVARLPGHTDYVYSVAWSPDGRELLSGSGDGTVRVWSDRPIAGVVDAGDMQDRAVRRFRPMVEQFLRAGLQPSGVEQALRREVALSDHDGEVVRQLVLASILGRE